MIDARGAILLCLRCFNLDCSPTEQPFVWMMVCQSTFQVIDRGSLEHHVVTDKRGHKPLRRCRASAPLARRRFSALDIRSNRVLAAA